MNIYAVADGSAASGSENHTTAPNGQSIKRKALLWAGYGPTSTDLHILCRMCTARGNAPLLPTAPPPEGEVLAALCFEMLMNSEAESRANFPLRGKSREAGIGVHFHEHSEVCLFSLARRAVVWFYHNGAFHYVKAPTTAADRQHKTLPSEPARSVGRTHRSVRQHMTGRTRAPQAPEPSCVWEYVQAPLPGFVQDDEWETGSYCGQRIADCRLPAPYFTNPLSAGAMTWPSPSQGAKVSWRGTQGASWAGVPFSMSPSFASCAS